MKQIKLKIAVNNMFFYTSQWIEILDKFSNDMISEIAKI